MDSNIQLQWLYFHRKYRDLKMTGNSRGGVEMRDGTSRLHIVREEDSIEEVWKEVDSREEGSQEVDCREVDRRPWTEPDLHFGANSRTDVIEGNLANSSTMTRVFFRDPMVKHNSREKYNWRGEINSPPSSKKI